ncbi:phage major capsid protein [Neiella sp. HB171785]|uniref:Phage major capsid protein n=1 Tax=Neiella litorisoli TaxID=2771431 RepID=A0A8J6QQ99_9GAMM|nr:phage major capsid protein [Neiella litorisoli]MBD1388564.1 phage major capsid protein [Neiella litorisoli]
MINPSSARNFQDLIDNAKPEVIATYDDKQEFSGMREQAPMFYSESLDTPLVSASELDAVDENLRNTYKRMMTTTTHAGACSSQPFNKATWKHVIVDTNKLSRLGMSIDTSGMFEGFPFFAGFDTAVQTQWLGENEEIPESNAQSVKFPYEIHTIGAFTIVSRRTSSLIPTILPNVRIAQANAIRESVEAALINGDSAVIASQPDGLLKQITENILNGFSKSIIEVMSEQFEILEGNGIDKEEIGVLMSPDVAKLARQVSTTKTFGSLWVPDQKIQVSKHVPAGTMVSGRFSDFQGVTSSKIDFLAHSYTPEGQPEIGATRVRSMFDVDSVVLDQKSFVKTTSIA